MYTHNITDEFFFSLWNLPFTKNQGGRVMIHVSPSDPSLCLPCMSALHYAYRYYRPTFPQLFDSEYTSQISALPEVVDVVI